MRMGSSQGTLNFVAAILSLSFHICVMEVMG